MSTSIDLWDIPFFEPPAGVTSNFVDPPSRATLVIVICSIIIIVMWIFFLLRMYSKALVTRSLGWDDAVGLVAAIGTTAYASNTIWEMNILGPHGWNIRALTITNQFGKNSTLISGGLYGVVMWFCKLSVFMLYLRIFGPNRWTRHLAYFGILLSCMIYFATSIIFVVSCTPRGNQTWKEALTTTRCTTGSYAPGYIQGAFGVFFDIYLFLLPLWPVWKLQMDNRRKLAVSAMFATGLLATAASIIGLYYRVLINQPGVDESWENPINQVLANVEMGVAVICGSMPHIAQIVRLWRAHRTKLVTSIRNLLSRSNGKLFRSSRTSANRGGQPLDSNEAMQDLPKFSGDDAQLKTHILGSMNGDGQFIHTVDYLRKI